MKQLLLLLAFSVLTLCAAPTGLDKAIRIQDGSDSRNTKSSRVTIDAQTNLLAGTLTATNSLTVGVSGQAIMTINNNMLVTNSSTASAWRFKLDSASNPIASIYDSAGAHLDLQILSSGHGGVVSSTSALYLGAAGTTQVALTATAYQPAGTVALGGNTSNGHWVDQFFSGTMTIWGTGAGGANYEKVTVIHNGSASGIVTKTMAGGTGTQRAFKWQNNSSADIFAIDPTTGIQSAYRTLTDGATVTLTCDVSKTIQHDTVTLGGNRTLAISGAINGMEGVLIVKQDGTGSRTLTLPASSKVISGGSGAITLTTTASAIDILSWTYDGTNYLWTYGKNFN